MSQPAAPRRSQAIAGLLAVLLAATGLLGAASRTVAADVHTDPATDDRPFARTLITAEDAADAAIAHSQAVPAAPGGTAIIARDDLHPDSLASATLQGALDGPLLLTSPNRLDPAVAADLHQRGRPVVAVPVGPLHVDADGIEVADPGQRLLQRGLVVDQSVVLQCHGSPRRIGRDRATTRMPARDGPRSLPGHG